MSPINQCLTIAVAVATVVVNNLSKEKNPFDLDS